MKRKSVKADVIVPEIVGNEETELYAKVRGYIAKARAKIYAVANTEMVMAYWNVGREIVKKQGGASRAKYGDGMIRFLSRMLTTEFGSGYTEASLRYMRMVYLAFPNRHTLCDKLNWSHYRLLASVENEKARKYYHDEAAASGWSVRDLKRQIEHYDIGQMNMYLSYFKEEVCEPKHSEPIGIVLGADKDDLMVHYATRGISNKLFVGRYKLYLPDKEQLRRELARAIEEESRRAISPRKRLASKPAAKRKDKSRIKYNIRQRQNSHF